MTRSLSGGGVLGGARDRQAGSACSGQSFRWRRIFSITLRSSIKAIYVDLHINRVM